MSFYAVLPVDPAAAAARPATLYVTADDIVRAQGAGAGELVRLTATVHAQGDSFSHVAVEFWDGELARGDQVIDGWVIPIVRRGESATANIFLDTSGLWGSRVVWVSIGRQSEEDIPTDNRANRTLELAPHWLYLSVAMKE